MHRFTLLTLVLVPLLGAGAEEPLTLARALQVAREQHPRLRAAKAQTRASASQVLTARAPFLPQIVGTLGYQRTTANFAPRPGQTPTAVTNLPDPSIDSFNYFSSGVSLNQLIWDFGQTLKRWQSTEATEGASRSAERTVALDVALGVRVAYVSAWGARALVAVARETLQNEERHLVQAQQLVLAETKTEIDVARTRAAVATARAQLIAAEGTHDAALVQLAQAIGVEQLPSTTLTDEVLGPLEGEDTDLDRLTATATAHRPELRVLEQQLLARRLTVESLKGGYWPTFSLSLGATYQGTELTRLAWNLSIGLSVSWALFQGLQTRGQVDEAEANVLVLEANDAAQRQAIRAELGQARIELRTAQGQRLASEEALVNAEQQLRLAEGRYTAGVGNIVEVGDAETARTNAANNVVVARFRIAAARVRLLRALGKE